MDHPACFPEVLSPATRRSLARRLTAWFKQAARDLPWRRTSDLYSIWVSEIMLQQTQVQTVIPYYNRFLATFPGVADLAAADEQHVLRLWEGLGYYRRARQMHAAAQIVMTNHGGQFPGTYDAVRSLPGIGRYTAGAVLSIGLGSRLPILEANTIRVLSRLSAFRGEPASTAGQKYLWSLAEAILPAKDVGIFNQALMELGSEICAPKAPQCQRCPVAIHCQAFAEGAQDQIPLAPKKTNYEALTEVAVVVNRGPRVLVRQCQPGERWAGLWDFPRFKSMANGDTLVHAQGIAARVEELTGLRVASGPLLTTFRHGVTRFRITLHCFQAKYLGTSTHSLSKELPTRSVSEGSIRWVTREDLSQLPLSTTGRKISQLLQAPPRTSRAAAVRRGGSRRKSC